MKKDPLHTLQPGKPNLNLIQLLRGIASLLVVFFHATTNLNSSLKRDFFFSAFNFGGAGVDIFFVLSGFIITYTSSKALANTNNPIPFLRRRFVRIYPSYWIVITLFLLVQFFLSSFYTTPYHYGFSNTLQTYFLFPGHIMVNGVSWTLSFELFFYLLFSLAFILPSKKNAFYLGVFYCVAIIMLHIFNYDSEKQNAWLMLISFPMNTEFFMGIIAALVIPKIPAKASKYLLVSGVVFFIVSAILFDKNIGLISNAFNRVIMFGVPSFFIIVGIVKYELTRPIAIHNVLLQLGEASYSLYLLHLPILVACIKIIAKLNFKNSLIIHSLILVIIVIICAVSILFFKYIEKPLIGKLNSYGRRFLNN